MVSVCVCERERCIPLSLQSWCRHRGQIWVCVLVLVQTILYTNVMCVCLSLCVTVWSFNGTVQAESYLLFYKGSDFPPRETRHIRCHYRELNCLCRERQIDLSIHLSTYLSFAVNLHIHIYICFILTVIRAKISGEKIVSPSNNSSPYMKMIQYEIKMIKVRPLETCYFCTVHQGR